MTTIDNTAETFFNRCGLFDLSGDDAGMGTWADMRKPPPSFSLIQLEDVGCNALLCYYYIHERIEIMLTSISHRTLDMVSHIPYFAHNCIYSLITKTLSCF
jgi:hypothetical protein